MFKKLKTLKQVKKLYENVMKQTDGIRLYNKIGKSVFINIEMYKYFGNEIEVQISNNIKFFYDYKQIDYCWLYCKEWFVNDLFTDEDFTI